MDRDNPTPQSILDRAAAAGRSVLTETEGLALLGALGIPLPAHVVVAAGGDPASACDILDGPSVVVKAVVPGLVHKSEAGAVRVVPRRADALREAVRDMTTRLDGAPEAFTVHAFVPPRGLLGEDWILGARWTSDFGPVVTLGPGGVQTEYLAGALPPDTTVHLAAGAAEAAAVDAVLRGHPLVPWAAGARRGLEALADPADLGAAVSALARFAREFVPDPVREIEINPLRLSGGSLHALDIHVRLGAAPPSPAPPRPAEGVDRLLRPESMAVIGVSQRMNPGHIVVRNTLAAGFDAERLFIVKPDTDAIDGVRCVPTLADLPEPVDLLVVAVAAEAVPDVLHEAVARDRARSVILLPGGLGERRGTETRADALRAELHAARSAGRTVVVNGGNCLGVRSGPGRYDTLFIPRERLDAGPRTPAPLAFLSQSGAFAVARLSRLHRLEPRYVVTLGNQLDLTLGDYLARFADDPGVEVTACYVEGFRPGDGLAWLEAARRMTTRSRPVVLYRAGRTPEGAAASASHTAAIAGDYAVTRSLARAAGVTVADTLEDFDDLVTAHVALRGRRPHGSRLGAVSNAGFECVTLADRLGGFRLAEFADATRDALADGLERARVGGIVEPRNPLDLTPIVGDEGFADAVEQVLADDAVDLAVVGCIPLTAALDTVEVGEGSVVHRLVDLWRRTTKPWVVALDAGPLYDRAADILEAGGVPVFRRLDRALLVLDAWAAFHRAAGNPTDPVT